ncbi:MAG TPA: DUF1028 domain-containing protein [Actinomycetota bacterium]|nr:DUF1028 domain-containing protein [Actinomycetota bacterium]
MTYSIVARDPETGELGVAVQSHWFAAGVVCWARAGVGAVATQATALIEHGPLALDLLERGLGAEAALAARGRADGDFGVRQVAVLDASGAVAVHTGESCIPEAGHRVGSGFSCQANMMRRDTVWDAMALAFEAAEGPLAERLLGALDAGEAEGGDLRGRQAARVLVVRGQRTDRPWEDVRLDLRVDDHPDPLAELRRLLVLTRSYDRLERAEELELAGDAEAALGERRAAIEGSGGNPEAGFWTAVSLAVQGRTDEARPLVAAAVRADPGWADLLRRLGQRRLSGVTPETASELLREA